MLRLSDRAAHIGILSRARLASLGIRAVPAAETSESIRNSCGQFDSRARHRGNLRNAYSNRCIACAVTCLEGSRGHLYSRAERTYYYCYTMRDTECRKRELSARN